MTHQELVQRAARWLRNTKGCSVVFTEFTTSLESPDAIGWQGGFSTLVECKASRADFLADRKKPFRRMPYMGMGCERYFMVPDQLVQPEELPDRWGLLYVHGRHVKLVRKAAGFAHRNRGREIGFLVSMLRRAELRVGPGVTLNAWLRWENRPHPEGRTNPVLG